MHAIVRRRLLAFLAIAAIAAPGLRMRGATQGTPVSGALFAKRVVTTRLVNPRYRDVTMRPDGLALFIATDVGGNTQDESGRPAAMVENAGAILEFRYITDRSR